MTARGQWLSPRYRCFRDDVVCREEKVLEAPAAKGLEDLERPIVMIVAVDKKGEGEASIEEDQSRELP